MPGRSHGQATCPIEQALHSSLRPFPTRSAPSRVLGCGARHRPRGPCDRHHSGQAGPTPTLSARHEATPCPRSPSSPPRPLPALVWAAATIGGPLPPPPAPLPARQLVERGRERGPPGSRARPASSPASGRRSRCTPTSAAPRAGWRSTASPTWWWTAPRPKRAVVFDYSDESDGVDHDTDQSFPFYPIPDEAITQPHYIEGGYPGNSGAGGDRHMLLVDKDNKHLYELFALRWTGTQWAAGSGAFFDLDEERPPARDLDLGRCRGPRHPARARALRRGLRPGRDRPRVPGHGGEDERLRRSRPPTPRAARRAPRPWARGCGSRRARTSRATRHPSRRSSAP